MKSFSQLWGRSPQIVLGLIQVTIALGTSFGLGLSGEQIAAIMTFSSLLIAFVTNSTTVPTHAHNDAINALKHPKD
jgi:hypothetical protein